jgi:hypothetical protein
VVIDRDSWCCQNQVSLKKLNSDLVSWASDNPKINDIYKELKSQLDGGMGEEDIPDGGNDYY